MKKIIVSFSCSFLLFFLLPTLSNAALPVSMTFHDAYVYYIQKAKDAHHQGDDIKALRYYKLAYIYATSDVDRKTAAIEIDLIKPGATADIKPSKQDIVQQAMERTEKNIDKKNIAVTDALERNSMGRSTVIAPGAKEASSKGTVKIKKSSRQIIFPEKISLADIQADAKGRMSIQIPLGRTLIVEDSNLLRFLVVDEGFLDVKLLNRNQLSIQALKRGSTFVHIWNDGIRKTLYVEIIFQPTTDEEVVEVATLETHNEPFKVSYSNDWSSYYQGHDISGLERQNISFLQNLAVYGPTPYGDIDSSLTFQGFDDASDIDGYTLGVSHIPMPGTSDLNIRAFDAVRNLTPLTLPSPHLRGIFADVDLWEETARVSLTHGQVRPAFGFLTTSLNANKLDAYVDAAKITLFPQDKKNHYSLNLATGYGSQRPAELTKKVYSVEGQQTIDRVTLNAELARNDDSRDAVLSGIRYEQGSFMTGVNMRNINKDYSNVINSSSNPGELGALWYSELYADKMDIQTNVDMYQNRLYFNPIDSDRVNFDANAHTHYQFSSRWWNDANVYYVHTPGELSPRRNIGLDDRVSRSFNTWNARSGTVYLGGTYQKSRYSDAPTSAYDRVSAISGVQVPLTDRLSAYSSYEYSWVHEIESGNDLNPNVFTMGSNYNRQITEKLNGTLGVNYRNEEGVEGTNSFLTGEDSLDGSIGLAYNPANDISFFFDSRLRRVWTHNLENPDYYDLDVRLGMRLTFGTGLRWDPSGTLSGYVFNDKNSNGKRDVAEEGIPNVKVNVGEHQVTTNKDGYYQMPYRARDVVVTTDAQSTPHGYVFTTLDNTRVKIRQWQSNTNNFGMASHSSIYGIIFVDLNSNGIPDANEKVMNKVKVLLDGKTLQMTDLRGAYYFRNVESGKHTITLMLDSLPINLVPLTKLKQEISVPDGTTYMLHFPLRAKEEQ